MKMENKKQPIYSYSKLTTFIQCEKQYFYQYILRKESQDNIYNLLGTTIHNCIEGIQKREMSNQEALETFHDDLEMNEIFGYSFISDKVKNNYVNSIIHFLKNFKPIDCIKYEIEKEVTANIDGHLLKGYVDCIIWNKDGTISVIDFKSSSMYKKSDLNLHGYQLLIYAIALQQMGYPPIKDIKWLMCKYATVKTKRSKKNILRCELDEEQEYEVCYVPFLYNDKIIEECESWICDTIEQIESKQEQFEEWKTTCDSSFFCNTLCSFCKSCPKAKKLKNSFFNR